MSGKDKIICENCGQEVPRGKYCRNCGALLKGTSLEEMTIQIDRIRSTIDHLENFHSNTSKTLSSSIKTKLEKIISGLTNLLHKLENQREAIKEDKERVEMICLFCGQKTKRVNFCSVCGKPLSRNQKEEDKEIYEFTRKLAFQLQELRKTVKPLLSEEIIIPLIEASGILHQFLKRYAIKTEKRVKEISKKPVTKEVERVSPKEQTIQPSLVREETFWSKFERNLLNYWFFYLAIILFSVGICITIYFVVINIDSELTQIGVIMGIGGGFALIGEILAIFSKIKSTNDNRKEDENKKAKKKKVTKKLIASEQFNYLRQIAAIVLFIGFTIIFVGAVLGMASSVPAPTGLFFYLGYCISIVAIVLGVVHNIELVVLLGVLQLIVFNAVDLLWEETPAILNEVSSFFMFLIPVVIVTLITIYFQQWVSSIVVTSVLPIMLCIPKIHQQIGLEFLIIFLIPIMMGLVIQFSAEKIPLPFRRSMVGLSMLFPAVALVVLTFTSKFVPTTEPAWGQLYPFEIFIGSFSILAAAFYYPFVQEEKLEIKSKNKILRIAGQILVGIVAIISVAVYTDAITTLLFFLTYFSLGILSSLKIQREYSLFDQILSIAISEILAIVLLSIIKSKTIADEIFIFIIGISYMIMACVSLFISEKIYKPEAMFSVWIIVSGINTILLGHTTNINTWLVFTAILLLIVSSIFVNLPVLLSEKGNWRPLSLVCLIVNAITISIFVFTSRIVSPTYAAFEYESLVIFLVFLVVSFPAFFNWQKKQEVVVNEA
ncbi:hypothetical protein EU523_01525 [Candidatus Heimdallarchaeota archaeon]|nr:MAG: hypothetical protein EU523_01525 [Candidatus Heimdallarchaeota archaeon]